MHSCPECNKQTEGSTNEGGCRWALCPDYYRLMIEQQRGQLDDEIKQIERRQVL